jgi:hypothetical protein
MAEQQETKEYKLPTGMKEFDAFAKRIIKKAGKFADEDSMVYAIAMELIHSDPKTQFSDEFFVTRLRKVAANQVASQIALDIKSRQMEAQKKAQEQQKAEATATQAVASNEKEN